MVVSLTSKFEKSFRKLNPNIQKKAVLKMKVFKDDPFDSRLDTHKLHGEKREEWAYSIDRSYRISFVFLGNRTVLYTEVGTHNKVY